MDSKNQNPKSNFGPDTLIACLFCEQKYIFFTISSIRKKSKSNNQDDFFGSGFQGLATSRGRKYPFAAAKYVDMRLQVREMRIKQYKWGLPKRKGWSLSPLPG